MVEAFAHAHIADVRYHSSGNSVSPKYFFHNLIISPGVTPIDGQNPGVAVFSVDPATLSPYNLVLHFINIE